MTMSKFEYSEQIVESFEKALEDAGMTNDISIDKPKFFRGSIPSNITDKLILRYQVTDKLGNYADNAYHTVSVYVNALMLINSQAGFNDPDYKSLMAKIEKNCLLQDIEVAYGIEDSDTMSGDNDSIQYSIQLEFSKRR